MKLNKLLQKITPLPWPVEPPDGSNNDNYIASRHCVAVLPELVAAARKTITYLNVTKSNCGCGEAHCGPCCLREALDRAENVEDK